MKLYHTIFGLLALVFLSSWASENPSVSSTELATDDLVELAKKDFSAFLSLAQKNNIQVFVGRPVNKNTPLHDAVFDHDKNKMYTLLGAGTDVNTIEAHGWTPMHLAAFTHDGEMALRLYDAGANVNARDSSGLTPLHMAAFLNNEQMVGILLEVVKDINPQDSEGRTPLHWVVAQNNGSMVRILRRGGVDVNAKDGSGKTVLEVAMYCRSVSAVRELLRASNLQIDEQVIHTDMAPEIRTLLEEELRARSIASKQWLPWLARKLRSVGDSMIPVAWTINWNTDPAVIISSPERSVDAQGAAQMATAVPLHLLATTI